MFIHLPPAIDNYINAENSGDADAMSRCFAPDAIVRDEGHTYEGLAAIKQWKTETKKKYNHSVEPLDAVERNGKTIVTSKLTGNFPNSPVTLEFIFGLKDDKIVSLEIR
jgi:hypothetical protein